MATSPTADRLLDVAESLVRRRGFNAFSYRDLADAVGIRTASIHYHFATKHDLALQLIARYTDRLLDALHEFDTTEPDLARRLDAYVDLYFQTAEDGESICLCGSMASDVGTLPEEVRGAIEVYYRHSTDWLVDTIEAGTTAGRFRPLIPAPVIASTALAALQGSLLEARVRGTREPLEHAASALRALLDRR